MLGRIVARSHPPVLKPTKNQFKSPKFRPEPATRPKDDDRSLEAASARSASDLSRDWRLSRLHVRFLCPRVHFSRVHLARVLIIPPSVSGRSSGKPQFCPPSLGFINRRQRLSTRARKQYPSSVRIGRHGTSGRVIRRTVCFGVLADGFFLFLTR